jgi:mono/diheme cytochrome c family protein
MRAVAAILLLAVSGGAVRAQAVAPAAAGGVFGSPFRFTEATGASIYQSVCAGCHMADGRGAVGAGAYPALAHDPRLAVAAYPIALVLQGQRAMPPFARYLSDQQVADVVGFIRRNFGNEYAEPISAQDVAAAR